MRESSKQHWESNDTDLHIKIGCLQRIADATEVMAKNHNQLISDLEMYKRWYNSEQKENTRLLNRVRALKGIITKLKRKQL